MAAVVTQDEVVSKLEAKGYRQVSSLRDGSVVLQKKPTHYTTLQAEVDPDGYVNGESVEDFLKGE